MDQQDGDNERALRVSFLYSWWLPYPIWRDMVPVSDTMSNTQDDVGR